MTIIPGDTLLFIGDSITDCGRSRELTGPNDRYALGCGFVQHIAQHLLADLPDHNLSIYNRGVAGNKSDELAARWQQDCLNLRPSLVTVMIGINDSWHRFRHSMRGVSVDDAASIQTRLFASLKHELPACRLVVLLPFLLRHGTGITDINEWEPEFTARQAMTRRIAAENGAQLLDIQSLFDTALSRAPASYWTTDGVHPGPAGHGLLARYWIDSQETMQ
jgi:lysophospholipase L1-like esterase